MKSGKFIGGLLLLLHLIVGIGAIAGGIAAILDPVAPLGASVELLRNAPFDTYLIPGLLLFGLVGLGNLFAAIWFIQKRPGQGYVSGFMGSVLVIWIVVQCYMLWDIVALHVIFGAVGAAQGLIALKLLWDQNLFPASLLRRWVNP